MSTLREAAQQALGFTLRDFKSLRDFEAARAVLHDALRDALAQQPQTPCPANDQPLNGRTLMRTEFHPWEKAAISPPNPGDFGIPKAYWEAAQHYANFWHQNRLDAAHPPCREWRGLTDDEISALFSSSLRSDYKPYSFARAIEAALKEKNHD